MLSVIFSAYIFMLKAIRFRSKSTSITFTVTTCSRLRCSAGSVMYLSVIWDTCISPFSFTPMSTKAPNLVRLLTFHCKIIPVRMSFISRMRSSNSIVFAAPRGSNPGFCSSFIMSVSVINPTSSVTKPSN